MSFPTVKNTAPLHQRYVGLYYYSTYWNKWDLVLAIRNGWWIVQGIAKGEEVRKHRTPLHADKFADKPFAVRSDTPLS